MGNFLYSSVGQFHCSFLNTFWQYCKPRRAPDIAKVHNRSFETWKLTGKKEVYYLYRRRPGGLVVNTLDSGSRGPDSSPGQVIVLCSWKRNFTLTVPLSTEEYKWVPANCQGNLTKCRGILPAMDQRSGTQKPITRVHVNGFRTA